MTEGIESRVANEPKFHILLDGSAGSVYPFAELNCDDPEIGSKGKSLNEGGRALSAPLRDCQRACKFLIGHLAALEPPIIASEDEVAIRITGQPEGVKVTAVYTGDATLDHPLINGQNSTIQLPPLN